MSLRIDIVVVQAQVTRVGGIVEHAHAVLYCEHAFWRFPHTQTMGCYAAFTSSDVSVCAVVGVNDGSFKEM